MLTINLAAIQENWKTLCSMTSAKVAGVIKADAYGLGASEVGAALYDAGCREFFVASLDEGMSARNYLPSDTVIYVLGGIRLGDEQNFVDANLIPVLCSVTELKRWAHFNSKLGAIAPSAIKLNSGMTRLGIDIHDLEMLCNDKDLIIACNPVLLMSHLACAEDPEHPLNMFQLFNFRKGVEEIRRLFPNIRLSLANSSGIFLGTSWHFDLVRPGAALYGIAPQIDQPNPTKPVVRLTLPIIQVRKLSDAASLGYGAEAVLPKESRIAIAVGGYADGINRTLGRNPEGIICGHNVYSVGRISMDVTMFDVSDVPLSDEQILNSHVEVINEKFSLDYLSRKNKALGYEVLTSLGSRYKRKYLGRNNGR